MNYLGEVVWWDLEAENELAERRWLQDRVQVGDPQGLIGEPRRGCIVPAVVVDGEKYDGITCDSGEEEVSVVAVESVAQDWDDAESDGGTWF